jgi:RNA 2',3'-cyclic 3'-phosphodiesterase
MRLFVAIELPKEVKDELFRIQKLIPSKFAKIKWVSKKNLHLTLKFIGETDVETISKKLKEIKFESFKLNLSKFEMCSRGKYTKKSYVARLWVNIKPLQNIIKLQQNVDSVLLGVVKGDQKFSPHLTLGRVKLVKKKEALVKVLKEISVNPLEFEINEFKLMQSKLTKDGPIYSVVERFKA